MMHPRQFALSHPDKTALIFEPSGTSLSFRELENQANTVAHFFRSVGLKAGSKVAFALENRVELLVFAWGAQRSGLIYVPVSWRQTADEIAYVVEDSGAELLLSSDIIGAGTMDALNGLLKNVKCYTVDSPMRGWLSWVDAISDQSTEPIADESCGIDMMYSSGTTGRPKGIMPQHDCTTPLDAPHTLTQLLSGSFGFAQESRYLCPAPLYHAAPLRWSCAASRLGMTIVVMEKFDAELTLDLIQEYKISHAQFVPTHFIRMLKLDQETRAKAEVGCLEFVVHAAAPCPVPIKQEMLDWWGPVINEYYAGSEGIGMTFISARDWLSHQGSVGQALAGKVHVCGEDGEPLPPGEEGLIYFESKTDFSYHNDSGKTAEAKNSYGWSTLGDIGRLDGDGYLYLTDRKSFMIISGGVNIYPQEIEDCLITHPKVRDVAVIGGPDPDMGERVIAVIQPEDMQMAGVKLADELADYCRSKLSGVKIPRRFDFREELPRGDNGKLYKKQIRAEYWESWPA